MAIRLLRYPDPRLNQPAAPVETFGAALAGLAAELGSALDTVPAIGLAAPHLGVLLRLVSVRLDGEVAVRHYVNPVIERASAETMVNAEGSVAMPGVVADIERPRVITLRYRDLDGREATETAQDFAAAVLQHEIDQLDGIFWIDRLSRLKRDRLIKRFRKLSG